MDTKATFVIILTSRVRNVEEMFDITFHITWSLGILNVVLMVQQNYSGQPIRKLNLKDSQFTDVTYNPSTNKFSFTNFSSEPEKQYRKLITIIPHQVIHLNGYPISISGLINFLPTVKMIPMGTSKCRYHGFFGHLCLSI